MGKADLFAASEPENRKELEGHSTNIECPKCKTGAMLYINRRGNLWCSFMECDYQINPKEHKIHGDRR